MGKGTDKLYITHSEWSSETAYSASAGSGVSGNQNEGASAFKRLPFNFCAVSLQPFKTPVSTAAGTIFDLEHIQHWLKKHDTNPINGDKLSEKNLIPLHFRRNEAGDYVDPVTYKVFTDNSHIVALKHTGNVFAWETVERLNIKAKMWRDLVSDEEFTRSDIITLQDPQNIEGRNLNSFQYLKDGIDTSTAEERQQRAAGVNKKALGETKSITKLQEADKQPKTGNSIKSASKSNSVASAAKSNGQSKVSIHTDRATPYNAAQHTTGKAAASFTSTGLTPVTSGERALLTDEEYMLKPKRVKIKGYARISTNLGDLNVELHTEQSPKAVWNFVQLSKKGFYKGLNFHRNIRNFMIQGGDPTGTGKGGTSIWGKNFVDEFDGPLTHDSRGVVSMANKGKNSNSSQFFITYRAAKHLDRKHTIFGKLVGGMDVLSLLENAPTDSETNRPKEPLEIEDIVVYLDPFEEFLKTKQQKENREKELEEIKKAGGIEDEKVTWTGKRIRADGSVDQDQDSASGIGKYIRNAGEIPVTTREEVVEDWDTYEEPKKKKAKAGGFGNFDSW